MSEISGQVSGSGSSETPLIEKAFWLCIDVVRPFTRYVSIVTKDENQTAKRGTVICDVDEPLRGYSADAEVDGFWDRARN